MNLDYIQRIDLDIVQTIITREIERIREIYDNIETDTEYERGINLGAMWALQEVRDQLRKYKKVGK